jgi:hypothetical protein
MSVKSITRLALSLVIGGVAVTLTLPGGAIAQVTNAQPLQDWQTTTDGSRDPFSTKSDGNAASSMFDMIHRANLGPTRSVGEFTDEQEESLDAAAAEFRRLQQQRLQSPSGVVPATPGNAIAPPQ